MIVIPGNACISSSIYCATDTGTAIVRYFWESHLATLMLSGSITAIIIEWTTHQMINWNGSTVSKIIRSSRLAAGTWISEAHTWIRPTLTVISLHMIQSTSFPHWTRFIYFFLDMRTLSRTVSNLCRQLTLILVETDVQKTITLRALICNFHRHRSIFIEFSLKLNTCIGELINLIRPYAADQNLLCACAVSLPR